MQGQHKPRHPRTTMAAQVAGTKRPASRQNSRNLPLGGKDLIIRMLAEVFQVNQTDSGQVKWQQVSSSLVPVSLYSRTTSSWLNYLLAAPTANAATSSSGMSPDSRDFLLLLLQQFHHQQQQQQQQQTSSKTIAQQSFLEQQNQVVFQVVAHDYLDGQCKKILNVKLVQPGTRLGQASDYFVYWKEQPLAYNHLQTSLSFNSNNSLSRLQNSHPYNEQEPPPQMNQFVATCCGQSFITQTPLPMTEPQTWGLNFASINDAKLFYDICSLNLVDLDFNSEYLKQLTLSLTSQNRNNLGVCQNLFPQAICGQPNEQKLIVDFLNYKQRQHNHSAIQTSNNSKFIQQQNPCQLSNRTLKKQSSQTKCPSCKHLLQSNDRQGHFKMDGAMVGSSSYNRQCSVHARQSGRDQTTGRQLSTGVPAQMRSRSSTRQLGTPLDETAGNHSSLKRARSFSTPATPEHNQDGCSHQQSGTDCEGHRHKQKQQDESHHPRCLSYIRLQKLRAEDSTQLKKKSIEVDRPRKPARGVLRDSNVTNVPDQRFASLTTTSNHQGSVESSQVLHSKRTPKPRYMSHQSSQDPSTNKHKLEQVVGQDHKCDDGGQLRSKPPRGLSHDQILLQNDQLDSVRFSQSKSARRRYTGIDSTEMSHFDSLSHHSASLARAQYANSKNMKEFLSLDAGGVPPAPGQIANMNQKFEEQMKAQNYRRQNKVFKQSAEQIKPSDPAVANDQAASYLAQGMVNTQQISTDSECLNNIVQSIEGPNSVNLDVTRHASTTTDDLPLDPLTKRKMYKLTSEEVISERTEPKSLLPTRWDLEQNGQQNAEGRDKDRQTRAISLGPELYDGFRGRDKRSDTGRRRSLERSMCVDLEPAPTVSSAFRKTYCLSPLEQSANPMTAGGVNSFENSPSFYSGRPVAQLIRVHQGPLVDIETPEDIPDKHTRFAGTPKRARTKSSSSYRPTVENPRQQKSNSNQSTRGDDGPSPFHNTNYKKFREEPIRFEPSTRIMSFKSAPDVTYYGDNPRHSNDSDYKNTMRDNVEFDEQSYLKLAASNIPSHSSYAVPLCSKVRSSQYGREFHSCPSSLRRVKRDPHHHCHGQQQLAEALKPVDECIRQSFSTRTVQNDCPYCVCGRRSANANLPAQCAIYDEANFATTRNKSFSKQQRRQRRCQHQYNHHHHHTTPVCMNNVSREQTSNRGPECCLTERADCMQASAPYRTCSSLQSCRSPLRYGLYESDCDEDPGDEEMAQASAVERPCQELTTCHTELPSTCCAAKSSHSYKETLARSASSFYFRPLDASTIIPFKPVNGYDQTMARSSLKSRQRARSQPPREPPETVGDTFHLNKSMETVQKLIKEVQNELNALKRCPLELFSSQTPSSAAKSQPGYSQPIQPEDAVCHTASRNASAQVSASVHLFVKPGSPFTYASTIFSKQL